MSRRRRPEMEQEYDFSTGQRGKYARHFAEGTNLVLLEGDVAAMFPDSRSVNRALRKLAEIIRESGSGPRSPAPTAKR